MKQVLNKERLYTAVFPLLKAVPVLSVVLFILSFFNLSTEHLADMDFDTAHAVYGLMFDESSLSSHPAILHPAIKFIYIPFSVLYKFGLHPLAALQVQYGIFLALSAVMFGVLCFRLTGNRNFSFFMFGAFGFFPPIEVIILTMDDNLYAYPFLFAGLILAFIPKNVSALNIYLRFTSSVLLFSLMFFISMTAFPFVIYLSIMFLINISFNLERKKGLRLLMLAALTGAVCTAAFFYSFAWIHGLTGKTLLEETLGWSQRFSDSVTAAVGTYSKMEFLKASVWNGLFSVARSETLASEIGLILSYVSGKSKAPFLMSYFLFYCLFIVKIFINFWKEKSFQNAFHTMNLMLLISIGLFFILWFQDVAFHERWDFFTLLFPGLHIWLMQGKKRQMLLH